MTRREILERIERLLERRLTGTLTPGEQAELERLYAEEIAGPAGAVVVGAAHARLATN
jgi:hypothetical protein